MLGGGLLLDVEVAEGVPPPPVAPAVLPAEALVLFAFVDAAVLFLFEDILLLLLRLLFSISLCCCFYILLSLNL